MSDSSSHELVIRDGRRFVLVPEEDWLGALATIEIMGQPGAVEAILEAAATPDEELLSELDWGEEDDLVVEPEDPNQCLATSDGSRCHKLRWTEHDEHHDLLTGKRWRS